MHTFRALQGQKSRLPTPLFLRIRVTLQIQAVKALGPGVEGDELVGGLVAGDELGGGGDGGGAVGGGVGVAAVVEDDDGGQALAVEAVDYVLQFEGDGVGGVFIPVGGHGVPEDGGQAEAAGDAQGLGAAGTIGRTKEDDGQAGDFFQSLGGAVDLLIDAAGGGQGEVEMGPGVVADAVAGGGDLANERGMGLGVTAYKEEGCADVAAGEEIEQAGGPDGVGTVVEGEGELAGARRGDERGAEEAGGGPEGRISTAARRQAERGGCAETGIDTYSQGGEHCASQCAAQRAGRARGKMRRVSEPASQQVSG